MELKITGAYKSSKSGEILAYSWIDEKSSKAGTSLREAFVEWIEKRGGRAYISKGKNKRTYYAVRVMPNGERTIQPSREGAWLKDTEKLTVLPA